MYYSYDANILDTGTCSWSEERKGKAYSAGLRFVEEERAFCARVDDFTQLFLVLTPPSSPSPSPSPSSSPSHFESTYRVRYYSPLLLSFFPPSPIVLPLSRSHIISNPSCSVPAPPPQNPLALPLPYELEPSTLKRKRMWVCVGRV